MNCFHKRLTTFLFSLAMVGAISGASSHATLPTQLIYLQPMAPLSAVKDSSEALAVAKILHSEFQIALQRALAGLNYTKTNDSVKTTLNVQEGLTFYSRLLTEGSERQVQVVKNIFNGRTIRRNTDLPRFLAAWLSGEHGAETLILFAQVFDTKDLAILKEIAQRKSIQVHRAQNFIILGSGFSYHLVKSVFTEAEEIKGAEQLTKFERAMNHLARRSIAFKFSEGQGAAAIFYPSQIKMAFVMPSRANLNTMTHETTHARFQEFERTLQKWISTKGYATPYQIDGPERLGETFGGFMNLLDELHAWRTGNSFDQVVDDQNILNTLRDFYGRQAGEEATKFFQKYWTAARVSGRSVPALILAEVRRLNHLSPAALLELSKRDNEADQINFLRVSTLRATPSTIPPDVLQRINELAQSGITARVRTLCTTFLSKSFVPRARLFGSQPLRELIQLDVEGRKWLSELGQVSKPLGFSIPGALYSHAGFAAAAFRWKLFEYDQVAARFASEFGATALPNEPDFKPVFNQLMRSPGKTLEEKGYRFIEAWNEKSADEVLETFLRTRDSNSATLLVQRYVADVGPEQVRRLVLATAAENDEEKQKNLLQVLEAIFNFRGFKPILGEARTKLNRARDPSQPLLKALDQALSESLLDGKRSAFRLPLTNFARARTYPEELPHLFKKIIWALEFDYGVVRYDGWLAGFFLVPKKQNVGEHMGWTLAVGRYLLDSTFAPAPSKEILVESIRLSLAAELGSEIFGQTSGEVLNQTIRDEALLQMTELSASQRKILEWSARAVWDSLQDAAPRVRRAAVYAIAENPPLAMFLEPKIREAFSTFKGESREALLELLALTEPGYLQSADCADLLLR